MIPLLKRFVHGLLYDDLAFRRWVRASLMLVAGSGAAFANDLATVLGDSGMVGAIKTAAVVAGALSVAITAGERNQRQ
jgi:hypothetical protein